MLSIFLYAVLKFEPTNRVHHEKGNLPYDSMSQSNTMLMSASEIIRVGNLGPHQGMQMKGLRLPNNTDKKSYNIYIIARNGSIMQMVRFVRVDGQWKIAMQVMRYDKVLKEQIDSDFPRNALGKI